MTHIRLLRSGLLCAIALVLGGRPSAAQNAGDSVFAGVSVHTINLKFSQPDYWDSLTIYYNQGLEQEIPVTAIVDGVQYPSVGVRFKGNSSFTYPNNKKSFKLNFDQYLTDQRWNGLKAVHLNNMWGDPSFMREKIHLDFCRDAGIHAPRANYVRLLLNDTLWGLYSLVEHVDKIFLKTHYNDKSGDLFKAVDAFDASGTAILSDFKWYGTADSSYASHYELKTDGSTTAWPKLRGFVDTLNNVAGTATIFPAKVNTTSLYKWLATDILFANLDSYINSGRNFYVYFLPATGKLEWVVWDVGLSFGAYAVGVSKLETMNLQYVISDTDRPLVGKVYGTPTLSSAYLATLGSVFTSYFTTARLYPHIDSVASAIRSYVSEDPRKMYTLLQFETNISSDVNADGGGGTRKPGLKSFITARVTSVRSQLTALGVTSVAGSDDAAGTRPSAYALGQNYPNPFNPSTTISFQLPAAALVRLDVFDLLGRQCASILNEEKAAGRYAVTFDASALPSGMYLYRLAAGSFVQTKMMTLVK